MEPSKVDEGQGIYPKYVVFKHPEFPTNLVIGHAENPEGTPIEMEEVTDFTFTLRPSKDYHARVAMAAYAESVRHWNEQLAEDLYEALSLAQSMPPRMEPT